MKKFKRVMFVAKLKLSVEEFFIRNRNIVWTRQIIFLTLAFTLLMSIPIAVSVTGWLFPEAFTYSFSVYAEANSNEVNVPEGELVDSNEWDPCGLTSVVCPGEESGTIESKVKKTFWERPEDGVATMRSESGLKADAMGWNCYYTRADGTQYSTSCKVEDREKAWSVDCGIAQNNVIGKTCPKEMFDVDYNLAVARKNYDRRLALTGDGFESWVGYTSGRYKKYL